ncbi:MAG: UDP-glucose 4-epimerase GalE [Planctomycetia bacterium]|nr:MAG: UDP-glucose 4-epimerase GalE [Planctomycetia bacterium]
MRVFVTGGAGYVGSHCVRALLAAGHAVTVFDNLVNGHRAAVDPRAELVVGDLLDPVAIRTALQRAAPEAVLHFAGLINVGESVQQPLLYYRANVLSSMNLLEAVQEAGVRRMVFSSTCAVYRPPERLPLVEDMPRAPISPYGETKLAVEWLLADCAAAWGLGSISLRYFNASGAAADGTIGEGHQPETHLIPLILQVALGQRSEIAILGDDYPTPDGTCIRDYIHVEDLAAAHVAAVGAIEPGRAEFLNVGTGIGHSVLAVIKAARSATGHAIPAKVVARRPGDPPALYADPRRVRERLGWAPRWTDLQEVVASAWRWHQAHPQGYAKGG